MPSLLINSKKEQVAFFKNDLNENLSTRCRCLLFSPTFIIFWDKTMRISPIPPIDLSFRIPYLNESARKYKAGLGDGREESRQKSFIHYHENYQTQKALQMEEPAWD